VFDNPWTGVISDKVLVHPEDAPYVNELNRLYRDDKDHQIETRLPPSPCIGYFEAPLVVLLANPSFITEDVATQQEPNNLELILAAATTAGGTPFWTLTEQGQKIDTNHWWTKHTRDLAEVVGGFKALSSRMLSVELHAYHSPKWSSPLMTLPTQHFSFALVQQAMDRDATIVVARCQNYWYASVPGLSKYKRQVANLKSPRSAHLSRKNLGDKGFRLVEKALTQPR